MENVDNKEMQGEQAEDFAAMFEQSLQTQGTVGVVQEGEIVKGTVIQLTKDFAIIDVGYKSEGQVPISEFTNARGEMNIKVGDKVDVLLESREDDKGMVVLSKEKADKMRIWDEISSACERDEIVKGTIIGRVKGGLSVDIGVKAFLPGSQVDIRPVRNLDQYIGKEFEFKVIKFNKKRGNIVLSRRVLLEKQREEFKRETLTRLKEGAVLMGVVKNLTDYGAFIDLGGIDGLLHITDMSWGHVRHPSEVFNVGDEVRVAVLKFDPESERVSLGLKQIQEDPWHRADEKYPVGTRVKGKVVSVIDYGAFIEIEPGVEGLIHVSEMSWTKRVKHPSKMLNIGDEVEAVVNHESVKSIASIPDKEIEKMDTPIRGHFSDKKLNTKSTKTPTAKDRMNPCCVCGKKMSIKAEVCPNCGNPTGVHVCPKCGSTNTKIISGVSKTTSTFLWGPFAINKVMSKFQCKDCWHKF